MKRNKKKDRKGIRNIREALKSYQEGLRIYRRGRVIYILKPGDSIDYGQLLRENKLKYRRYEGNYAYKGKRS